MGEILREKCNESLTTNNIGNCLYRNSYPNIILPNGKVKRIDEMKKSRAGKRTGDRIPTVWLSIL